MRQNVPPVSQSGACEVSHRGTGLRDVRVRRMRACVRGAVRLDCAPMRIDRANRHPAILWAAPLAEVTDSAFRAMAFEHGADRCTTEMVSAAGLSRGSEASLALLERLPEERGETFAQLYGSNPGELEEAARRVAALGRFQGLDLNAGCPAPKVLRVGGGAALLEDTSLLRRLVAALVRGAGGLPVSVKTRIGPDPSRPIAAELARIVEGEGAACVALHGRYASARHSGPCDWTQVAAAVAAVEIPVFANGGIRSPGDALDALRETGAAGLLVGRGAVGCPFLFAEIRAALAGEAPPSPALPPNETADGATPPSAATLARRAAPIPEVVAAVRRHLALSLALKRQMKAAHPDACTFDPELAVALDFRRHVFTYFRNRPGASALRRRLNDLRTPDAILAAVADCFPDARGGLPSESGLC